MSGTAGNDRNDASEANALGRAALYRRHNGLSTNKNFAGQWRLNRVIAVRTGDGYDLKRASRLGRPGSGLCGDACGSCFAKWPADAVGAVFGLRLEQENSR